MRALVWSTRRPIAAGTTSFAQSGACAAVRNRHATPSRPPSGQGSVVVGELRPTAVVLVVVVVETIVVLDALVVVTDATVVVDVVVTVVVVVVTAVVEEVVLVVDVVVVGAPVAVVDVV